MHRPRTNLVDAPEFESGRLSPEFQHAAAREVAEFKQEHAQRLPGRIPDGIDEVELLREVMNTVGKGSGDDLVDDRVSAGRPMWTLIAESTAVSIFPAAPGKRGRRTGRPGSGPDHRRGQAHRCHGRVSRLWRHRFPGAWPLPADAAGLPDWPARRW
jgi:hypothetical protein